MTIEIANRLQQLRKQNNFSQEELAEKIGVSRQAISKWERAEASPDTDNLLLLAKLYNVSLDQMLRTDESILNLNYDFRNVSENNTDAKFENDSKISLKKEDYAVKEAMPEGKFTNIEIYPQSIPSEPQGSPFSNDEAYTKNIAAEAPKSEFTTAKEYTAETRSEKMQNNPGYSYQNNTSSDSNTSGNNPYSQMGIDFGKMGKDIGKGLEIAGKELGKGIDALGKEINKQIEIAKAAEAEKKKNGQQNTADNSYNYNYNYSYNYSDKGQSEYSDQTENCCSKRKHRRKDKKKDKVTNPAYYFPYPIFVTIIFLVAGVFLDWWHPAWMLFLTIPLYYTSIAAKEKNKPVIFCYPVFVTFIFLALGFLINAWGWAWIVFVSIPLFYMWAGSNHRNNNENQNNYNQYNN